MTEQIKTDFEKIVKTSVFSEKDIELKKMYLNIWHSVSSTFISH